MFNNWDLILLCIQRDLSFTYLVSYSPFLSLIVSYSRTEYSVRSLKHSVGSVWNWAEPKNQKSKFLILQTNPNESFLKIETKTELIYLICSIWFDKIEILNSIFCKSDTACYLLHVRPSIYQWPKSTRVSKIFKTIY